MNVQFHIDEEKNITKVEYFVDGVRVGSLDSYVDSFKFIPDEYSIGKGEHTLYVLVYTNSGVEGGSSITFKVR